MPVASDAVPTFFAAPPTDEVLRRLPRLLLGLVLCGVAFALIVDARLGLDPWNVLHEGIADRTGLDIGLVTTLLGFVILLAWIPLRERIGIGTLANVVIIGTVMDLVVPHLPHTDHLATRWALLALGLVLVGPGIGYYIGARLGPGPRDGIMTGLAQRGPSIPTRAHGDRARGPCVRLGTGRHGRHRHRALRPHRRTQRPVLARDARPGPSARLRPQFDPEVDPDATLAVN